MKPDIQASAFGVLPLSLPNGVKLINIKVLGDQAGAGDVSTEVFQESRTAPFTRVSLVEVKGLADAATVPTPFPNAPVFDSATNLYYINVQVINAAQVSIRLRGFQITYQP